MATLDSAIQQMLAAGMPNFPDGVPIADGRIHRYGPKKRAWYVLHEFIARNSGRYVQGAFGEWGRTESLKIESDYTGMPPDERERLQRSMDALAEKEKKKRADRARFASLRAHAQWKQARATGDSPYLKKKGVEGDVGLRYTSDGTLLVPMIRYDVKEEDANDPKPDAPQRLVGLQKISPDGEKRFNKGMAKEGAACRIGQKAKDGQPILITEGLATALSIRMAVERAHPVFVAFDAGNLAPVARILRKLFPNSPILFCADDDAYLEAQLNKRLRDFHGIATLYRVSDGEITLAGPKGAVTVRSAFQDDDRGTQGLTGAITVDDQVNAFGFVNAGRTKAWASAGEVGNAFVCWPQFAERDLDPDPEAPHLTDFNDLHAREGLPALAEQLRVALSGITSGTATPTGAATPKGDKKPRDDEEDDKQYRRLKEIFGRYTLIYPSDEAFDHDLGEIVKIAHIRAAYGKRLVDRWLASEKRNLVNKADVVFDPSGAADHERGKVNLFRGWELEPSAHASCDKLIALLQYLCGERDQGEAPATDWILKWLAFPLQRPGAKMDTAVVMYGKEGTGKNLFGRAMREIYGTHGCFITQRQLESDFNTWASAKLLVIANEVVTRQEMTHHVGYLKTLITEPEIHINPKNIAERLEANHMNLMFFSNEFQPLKISPDDRRYLVVRTPPKLEKEYYRAVADELAAGGAAALYRYLLDLDLDGFDAHTDAIQTEAKRELVQLGMSSAQLFWQDLHPDEDPPDDPQAAQPRGELGLPYCPALKEHVYEAYLHWCKRNGEKMPLRINRFVPEFRSMNGVREARPRVSDPSLQDLTAEQRQRRVFLMGEKPAKVEETRWISLGVKQFHSALLDLRKGSA